MSSPFSVHHHTLPAQHIREYPNATLDQHATLTLAINEYRPLDDDPSASGSITIIGAHANGLPKETYEPLWEDLYARLKEKRIKVRAIWIADTAAQGASGVLNESLIGDDPSYFDHSRDLLGLINAFRDQMIRPIVGVGHSMGCLQLVQLAHIHPRLFTTLALFEPVIIDLPPQGPNASFLTSKRPDLWPSRAVAEASIKKNPFFKALDPRVLDLYLKHGLREVPTKLFPETSGTQFDGRAALPTPGAVTLTTTKHQEAWSYLRPNFYSHPAPPSTSPQATSEEVTRWLAPDLDPYHEGTNLFHRAECVITHRNLPYVRPPVLWIYGAKSHINIPLVRKSHLKTTGTGIGGNGGASAGQVKGIAVENATHMMPLEKVSEGAATVAEWLKERLDDWDRQESFLKKFDTGKSENERSVMSKQWIEGTKLPAATKREGYDEKVKGKL